MVLNIPGGLFGQQGNLGPIIKEEHRTVSSTNGNTLMFKPGATTGPGSFLNVDTASLGVKSTGYKVVVEISNWTGSDDIYGYTIRNNTKGVDLDVITGQSVTNGAVHVNTFFYSLDQVAEGDELRFTLNDGVLGTTAASSILGYLKFYVHSVDERDLT